MPKIHYTRYPVAW